MRYGSVAVGAGFLASIACLAAAQSPTLALSVEVGLWEVTTRATVDGQLPPIDTSAMTPAERANIEAAAKAILGTHTSTAKQCVTAEKLQQGIFVVPGDPGFTCQQSIRKNTATVAEVRLSCTGAEGQKMSAEIHVEARSPSALTGTTRSQKTQQGRTLKMDGTMTGRWIAADCGDVR